MLESSSSVFGKSNRLAPPLTERAQKNMTKLPNFVVVGAPKSGTTSLYFYLRQHPNIYLPKIKELHYFSFPELGLHSSGPGDAAVLSGLCQTWGQYTAQYADVSNHSAIGDISPSYLYYSSSARKIVETLGLVRIVAIVRNPVDKAYSQYMHMVREGLETLSFSDAIAAESGRRDQGWGDMWRYMESSLYGDRLDEFVTVFGQENVKVILFEDFIENTPSILTDLLNFIGVNPEIEISTDETFNRTGMPRSRYISDILRNQSPLKNLVKQVLPVELRYRLRNWLMDLNTGAKPELPAHLRMSLMNYFREDIAKVERLLGKPTEWLESNISH